MSMIEFWLMNSMMELSQLLYENLINYTDEIKQRFERLSEIKGDLKFSLPSRQDKRLCFGFVRRSRGGIVFGTMCSL